MKNYKAYGPFVTMLMDKYRPGWKDRREKRKSIWHLPKILLFIGLFVGIWCCLFMGMWKIHTIFFPIHANQLKNFWPQNITTPAFISSFLLSMPLFLPAVGFACFFTNIVFYLIPPARKAFEKEAAGDDEMTFSGATSKVWAITIKYLLPIGIGLSFIGVVTLISLK